MHRDIILRTAASQKSDNQSVKLIDSRGKKSGASKISIYSHKYAISANLPQKQQLKICRASDKKTQEFSNTTPMNPSFRQILQSESKRQDIQVKQITLQQTLHPTTTIFDSTQIKQQKVVVDATLAASFREHLQAVRIYYEGKIKQILQENAKAISELRNLLIQQQHRISQKEEQINKLMNATQNQIANCRAPPIRISVAESPHKPRAINSNASYEYLCNKVKDLNTNIKLIMEQFIDSEDQIKTKLERVQAQFIRYFAEKLGRCWFRLVKFIQNIDNKYSGLQKYIQQLHSQSAKNNPNAELDIFYNKLSSQLRQKINQFSVDIQNFSRKQYKYENQRVESLQSVLVDLLGKFGALERRSSLHGSRRVENGYFLEDEDEFFYPSSERKVYENNDDYEHFQSESDEEHPNFIKQNISNNFQNYRSEKLKNF